MKWVSLKVVTVGVVVMILLAVAYEGKVIYNGAYNWPPPPVDSIWVRQFMGNVSHAIGIPLTENATLDRVAAERFTTAALEPDITHFGADTELPLNTGEVIYYPSGYSPSGFVQGIEYKSPLHWRIMASYGFTQYGYHLGLGRVATVSENCQAPELEGPNINVTQFFAQYGCAITWVTSIWLLIDMSK
jgi:hypothetical protein